jgi:hypothetical protein
MQIQKVFIGLVYLTIIVCYLWIAQGIRAFVNDTGGESVIVWNILPTLLAFLLIAIAAYIIRKFGKFAQIALVVILDFLYVIISLISFVFYATNILLKMG